MEIDQLQSRPYAGNEEYNRYHREKKRRERANNPLYGRSKAEQARWLEKHAAAAMSDDLAAWWLDRKRRAVDSAMKRSKGSKGGPRHAKPTLGFDADRQEVKAAMALAPTWTHCPILGIPLDRRENTDGYPEPNRKLPGSKGGLYVRGNVEFVSRKANRLISDFTSAELRRGLAYLEKIEAA